MRKLIISFLIFIILSVSIIPTPLNAAFKPYDAELSGVVEAVFYQMFRQDEYGYQGCLNGVDVFIFGRKTKPKDGIVKVTTNSTFKQKKSYFKFRTMYPNQDTNFLSVCY